MKKLIAFLFIIALFIPCLSYSQVASGSVTRANMKLSIVNGTAFVDFTAALSLTPYTGKRIVIKDTAGKSLTGYIKAAGTGETYTDVIGGSNPNLKNGDFASGDTVWTKGAWSIADGVASLTAGTSNIYQAANEAAHVLYKNIFSCVVTGGSVKPQFNGVINVTGTTRTGTGTYTEYLLTTASVQANGFFSYVGTEFTGTIDDITLQRVLTPSATGVTIVSANGGTTYNWASEETGFNRNDASGYTYTIRNPGKGNSLLLLGVGR